MSHCGIDIFQRGSLLIKIPDDVPMTLVTCHRRQSAQIFHRQNVDITNVFDKRRLNLSTLNRSRNFDPSQSVSLNID